MCSYQSRRRLSRAIRSQRAPLAAWDAYPLAFVVNIVSLHSITGGRSWGVQFVTLLLFSLVTGVFWGTWFSLSRSMAEITPGTFLEVGRLMITNLGGPMSVLMPMALLSAFVLCVVLFRDRQTRASLFATAALVLMAIALVITLVVNVPIDRQIHSWTTATLPPDWKAIRDRWEFYHGLRTLVSLSALASLFASTLSTAWRNARDRVARRDVHPGTSHSTAA